MSGFLYALLYTHLMNEIKIYGALWCKETRRVTSILAAHNRDYILLNIDDPENGKKYTSQVIDLNKGKRVLPTLIVQDEIFPNPTNKELEYLIKESQEEETLTKCSTNKELNDGDSVLLTRDLDVKGSSLQLKQGTQIDKIQLTGDPTYIDAKIGKSTISLKTQFIKRKG